MCRSIVICAVCIALGSSGCDTSPQEIVDASPPVPSSSRVFPDDGADLAYFGSAVAVSGGLLAVGASGDDSGGLDSGAVYIFAREGTEWVRKARLRPEDAAAGDHFGAAVALADSTLVVGATGSAHEGVRNAGAVYILEQRDIGWVQTAKLVAPDREHGDEFGSSVSLSGGMLAIGARSDDADGFNTGSIYIFQRDGGGWKPLSSARLTR
ncbi:MAG: FG-GAP repeat protein [Proteobacteria bacterium]|nr:FG-GAP repeat protein [Pseudomonadota bacterium]